MNYHQQILDLQAQGEPFVSVTLVDAVGSAPQNVGARILVTSTGLLCGTIGGGKVEAHCIRYAQGLLQQQAKSAFAYQEWNLQTDIGMTCGGLGRFFFEVFVKPRWHLAVFGAGHVAQALVPVLSTLDCQLWCIDSRQEWLDKLPTAANLQTIQADQPADQVAHLPDDCLVISMTMGHAHDVPILEQIFLRQQQQPEAFPFVGVIGSHAKAGALKRDLKNRQLPPEQIAQIVCPVGLPLGNNQPAEIAISIAAQLLQVRDQLFQVSEKWQKPAHRRQQALQAKLASDSPT